MKRALSNAFILCGYILGHNEKNVASPTQLDFVIRHDRVTKGVEVLVNRLWEMTDGDVELIMEANDILKGKLTITKTGEISVKFQDS